MFNWFLAEKSHEKKKRINTCLPLKYHWIRKEHKLWSNNMDISPHKHVDCTEHVSMLCLLWHPHRPPTRPLRTYRGHVTGFQKPFFILFTKVYHTLDSIFKKWGVNTQQKWSFETTVTPSVHYCIVQQASGTAKATLTARFMSGKTFFVGFF